MARDHHLLPYLSTAAGIATFSVMDALMKGASLAVGAYSAMLVRSIIGAVLMFPLWRHSGGHWPDRRALGIHALRGAVSSVMATSFFWGLVRTPIAVGIGISFIAPLIALYLAAVVLGERIERRAILASLLGLGGVVVIAAAQLGDPRLGNEAAWGIGAILASAAFYAWNLILQRQQAQVAAPREIAFFQTLFVGLFLSLASPWLLSLPPAGALAQILGAAVLAMVSIMLLSWGYARAEAQALLPIEYTAFIWAALMGWLMFREPVSAATLAGVALIVWGCWIAAPRRPTEQTAL